MGILKRNNLNFAQAMARVFQCLAVSRAEWYDRSKKRPYKTVLVLDCNLDERHSDGRGHVVRGPHTFVKAVRRDGRTGVLGGSWFVSDCDIMARDWMVVGKCQDYDAPAKERK